MHFVQRIHKKDVADHYVAVGNMVSKQWRYEYGLL